MSKQQSKGVTKMNQQQPAGKPATTPAATPAATPATNGAKGQQALPAAPAAAAVKFDAATAPLETIVELPLDLLLVDYDWNGRSKRHVMANESDGVQDTTRAGEHQNLGEGLKGMCVTMRMRGQDTPVTVRRVENGKSLGGRKTDKPFELVAGFRRYTAIEMVNTSDEHQAHAKAMGNKTWVPNVANGAIRAIIRELDPIAARILNGRENTDRQNLETEDLLRLVSDLLSLGLTQKHVGAELAITQGYVSKLGRISELPKIVTGHWRGDSKIPGLPATVPHAARLADMIDLCDAVASGKLTEQETVKRYCEMVNPVATPPAAGGTPAAEKDAVADRIEKAATLAGQLVKAGLLNPGNLDWARVIGPKKEGYLIDTGKVDAAKKAKYADIAIAAYKAATAFEATPAAAPTAAVEN